MVPGVEAKKQTVLFLFSGVPRSTARLSKDRKSSSFIFSQSVHGQSNTTPIGSKYIWTLWITSGHLGHSGDALIPPDMSHILRDVHLGSRQPGHMGPL